MKKNSKNSQSRVILFVSVDPERDTPEKLKNYVAVFDPAFTEVTGPQAELAGVIN